MTHISNFVLDAFLDGELSEEVLHRVNGHLSICDKCRQRASTQRQLFTALLPAQPEPVPVDLAPIVMARIRQEALPLSAHVLLSAQVLGALLIIVWLAPVLNGWVGMLQSFSLPTVSFELRSAIESIRAGQTVAENSFGQIGGLSLGIMDWIVLVAAGGLLWLSANRLLLNIHFRIVKSSPEASI